ncbi:hypothetical protein ACWGA9_37810 [Streptomyces sp. NPDC054950]
MQMLLPAKYMIAVAPEGEVPDRVPSWAQWQGAAQTYWITDIAMQGVYPAETTLQNLWDNGVRQADFFRSGAGWGFHTWLSDAAGWPCLTFTNLTNDLVQLTASTDQVSYLQNELHIGPGQSCVLSPQESCSLQVTDFNNPLVQVAQIPIAVTFGMKLEFGALTTVSGCQFTTPVDGSPARIGLIRIPDTQT